MAKNGQNGPFLAMHRHRRNVKTRVFWEGPNGLWEGPWPQKPPAGSARVNSRYLFQACCIFLNFRRFPQIPRSSLISIEKGNFPICGPGSATTG